MMELSRRKLMAASLGAASGAWIASAHAESKSWDPDLEEINARLMKISERGSTLSFEQKIIVLLSTAAAQALLEEAAGIVREALRQKTDPVLIKEALYHCAPYVGIGRVKAVLPAVNKEMENLGISLPLPSQKQVSDSDRLKKGIEVQTAIFGDAISKMHESTPAELKPLMIDDLSGYCFGDFYTRTGMSIRQRELAVFSAIAALGGCEAQLKAHAAANLKEGNSRQNLRDALQIALPLNGFPRTLNALAVVNAA